jgi:catechol 2,3-dioxygenase-like lactoylglutathione lyase family enzyme
MRTLHIGLRVADLDRSLEFYTAVGYEVAGSVPETPLGKLVMLKLPRDDFVTIELVYDPENHADPGTGLSHLVIQVESMDAAIADLSPGAWRPSRRTHTAARTFSRPGLSTPTETESSWSSGRPVIPRA